MRVLAGMGMAMAGLLVGLGVAVFAKAVAVAGFDHLVLGHIVGPGLVAAGLARIKLQRALDARGDGPEAGGGDDGRAS
jgi:hypothetical protein